MLVDEDGAPRELRGEHLTIHTAPDKAGKLYPKQVVARGDVRAVQEGDELSSQELTIDLVPAAPAPLDPQKQRLAAKQKGAAKPGAKEKSTTSVELKQLVARHNVRAVSAAGDVATGDTLVVTNGPDGKPEVGLVGQAGERRQRDGHRDHEREDPHAQRRARRGRSARARCTRRWKTRTPRRPSGT